MVKQDLPENYKQKYKLDLKESRHVVILNIISLVAVVAMILIMNAFIPINSIVSKHSSMNSVLLKVVVIAAGFLTYIVLHEGVHGLMMKIFGAKNIKFGFKSMYFYAGSNEYFSKGVYILTALAPVVVWGIVLVGVNFIVPYDWIWVVYFLQIINISSSCGDLYVAFNFVRFNKDVLIQDAGTNMVVYLNQD